MISFASLTPLTIVTAIVKCYVGYRVFRTLFAFLTAVMIYKIIPIFRKPYLLKYKHRWTVVTGGTDGIGKAYTFELARRGLRKFFLIGRNQIKLDAVKKQLENEFSAKVQTYLFEFFDGDYQLLRKELSTLDIGLAVNSVGVGREYLERFGDNPAADWQILKVNGLGACEFLSCILPPMESYGGGQIVNLSSSQGIRPITFLAAYSSAKAMLCFVSDCISREYKTIKCQCLTPAIVATKMTYYEDGGIFVVTPKAFVKEAINSIGLANTTSGCFNHEIQMLLMHMFPWSLLKYLLMPIYWYQQRRMIKLFGDKNKLNSNSKRLESPKVGDKEPELHELSSNCIDHSKKMPHDHL